MTKKRFIKLLMSNGEQPRRARAIASLYNDLSIPYKKAYSDYLIQSGIARAFSRMGEAAQKAGESLRSMTIQLRKLAEAMK